MSNIVTKDFDFGLNDDKGISLRVGDTVHIENTDPKFGFIMQKQLLFERGVFGFREEKDKNLIPIGWHVGFNKVIKI